LGDDPIRALELAPQICELFNWDNECCEIELTRLKNHFDKKNYSIN